MKGSSSRSGPAPDPNSLRRDRNTDGEWTTLPAAGRPGAPPKWPLTRPIARETALWVILWAYPQAVEWQRLGLEVEVALYARTLTQAEERGASAAMLGRIAQQRDHLGLSMPGLARNRWRIAKTAPAAGADVQDISSAASHRRLTVVPPRADSA